MLIVIKHFWNNIDVFKDVVTITHTYIVISVSQTPGPSSVQDVNKIPIAMPCDPDSLVIWYLITTSQSLSTT